MGGQEGGKVKVVMAAVPAMGHVQPLLHIGAELARRGHSVWLASCAFFGKKVADKCKAAGIVFIPCSENEESEKRIEECESTGRTLEAYYIGNQELKRGLVEAAKEIGPHVILGDFMTLPAALEAADAFNIPLVVNFSDPSVLMVAGPRPPSCLPYIMSTIGPLLFGIPKSEGPFLFSLFRDAIAAAKECTCIVNTFNGFPEVQINQVPDSMVLTGPPAPILADPVEKTSMQSLNDWLGGVRAQGLKIVYVTFGTMVRMTETHVSSIFNGLQVLPNIAVIWSLKEAQQQFLPAEELSESLKERFFVSSWLPQVEIVNLPEVVAVISHCGWNGATEIMGAAKPCVAVPFVGDQVDTAAYMKKLRVAEVIAQSKITAEKVTRATKAVVENASYAHAAKSLQEKLLKCGGARQIADVLEECAWKRRPIKVQTAGGCCWWLG